MKKRLTPLLLAIPLLLAGCGATDTESTPPPAEETTTTESTQPESTTTEQPTISTSQQTTSTTVAPEPAPTTTQATVTPTPTPQQAQAPGAEDLILISQPSELSLAMYMSPDDGSTYVCDDRGTNPHIELGANGCAGPMSYTEAQEVIGQGFVDALEQAGSEIAEANGETFTP